MFPIITRPRVLISGGAGFIGANLINKLLELNYSVNIIIKDSTNLWRIKKIISRIHLHKSDLLDIDNVKKIIKKINPSVVFHLAIFSRYGDQKASIEMVETNIKGTINLLNATKEINYDIFVNTGSSSEYGIKDMPMKESDLLEPVTFYAATKASATLLCQVFAKTYNKPIVTLRPFSVYGPLEDEKRFIPTIIKSAIESKPIMLTPGSQRRDFIFIEDVVNAYIKTIFCKKQLSGQILNMGTGIEYTNDEVVKILFKVTGKKVEIKKGAFPKRLWDTRHWVADTSKINKFLDWKPKFTLEKGLKKTYEWYRNTNDE